MSRLLMILVLGIIAVATAFRMPARVGTAANRVIIKRTNVNLVPTDIILGSTNAMTQFSHLLAAESDFGGYTGPAGSLLLIAFLILTLAPPLAEKNANA